ncbi:hypothetical protein [Methylophilus sp. DW102]|uniref:hypothetical protein n=1 Tax=Methylophilus sp. DW102 TaxID=3095607 RepID=UPI00309023B8|nr:hypothetical protein MTDW_22350 [Methylophilus sp. DW102]
MEKEFSISIKWIVIVLSTSLVACESKPPPPQESVMAQYGCLPELEANDQTDKRLVDSGILKLFLRENPEYHVSTLKDISDHPDIFRWCLHSQQEQKFQQKFKEEFFRPMVSADTNQDGYLDFIVVLVSNAKFSVVVFNGLENEQHSKPYWLIQNDPEIIFGVEVNESEFIMPMYCTGCDSNPVFHWEGDDYDLYGHIKDESVCLAEHTQAYIKPDPSSDIVWSAERDQMVVITDIGPRNNNEYRWYQISLQDELEAIGYVQSNGFQDEPGSCPL